MAKKPIFAFIDASNLFYGGEKSLGWKIDYKKLLDYLKIKYQVRKIFYYGGIETFGFKYSVLEQKSLNLSSLLKHLSKIKKNNNPDIEKTAKRIKFYLNLEKFGYQLIIKPVKIYYNEDGSVTKKANCDVDMTFDLMRYFNDYAGVVALTGDGDFAVVLNYIQQQKKSLIILARAERTAREMKKLAGTNFCDFNYLKKILRF